MGDFELRFHVFEGNDGTYFYSLRRESRYGATDPLMRSTDSYPTEDAAHLAVLRLVQWMRSDEGKHLHDVELPVQEEPEDG